VHQVREIFRVARVKPQGYAELLDHGRGQVPFSVDDEFQEGRRTDAGLLGEPPVGKALAGPFPISVIMFQVFPVVDELE
jgi:hypothetical protein